MPPEIILLNYAFLKSKFAQKKRQILRKREATFAMPALISYDPSSVFRWMPENEVWMKLKMLPAFICGGNCKVCACPLRTLQNL
jgi:hypothetical protein